MIPKFSTHPRSRRPGTSLVILFLIMTFGCAKTVGTLRWDTFTVFPKKKTYAETIQWDNVQTGDILIHECDGGLLGWLGHCGIVTSEVSVAEIPNPFAVVDYYKLEAWKEARRVAVLRLRGMDDSFRDALLKNIRESIGKPYACRPKKSQRAYTCSNFVWSMFYYTGKEKGRHVDIDANGGLLAMPSDFLGDNDLWVVDAMK